MAGDALNSAEVSSAIKSLRAYKCPQCQGRISLLNDIEAKCYNCGRTYRRGSKNGTNGHHGINGVHTVPPPPPVDEWEKAQILDALTEQYMRAAGNARRSRLQASVDLSLQKAARIHELMEKIKKW